MDIITKIRPLVEAEGYEIAHGEEGYGERMFGLVILVKMSERKLCDDDSTALYQATDDLKRSLQTVSAKLDPEGPAKRAAARREIEDIYKAAGVDSIFIEELPNGYCSQPCCFNKPWFRVTSKIGRVELGWRKRVMSIDWKDSIVKASGQELFPGQDVTRWETGIHAWGLSSAIHYIRVLHG